MNCPTCTAPLRPIRYEGVSIHTCDGCGGEFVGPDEIAHIVGVREARFGPELAAALASRTPAFGVPESEAARSVACPGCRGRMRPVNYSADTGVCVDRCGSCRGLWLENAELEKIQLLLERWQDEAPAKIRAAATKLAEAQSRAAAASGRAFKASRFAFVNAVINRLLDAA